MLFYNLGLAAGQSEGKALSASLLLGVIGGMILLDYILFQARKNELDTRSLKRIAEWLLLGIAECLHISTRPEKAKVVKSPSIFSVLTPATSRTVPKSKRGECCFLGECGTWHKEKNTHTHHTWPSPPTDSLQTDGPLCVVSVG